MNYYGMIALWTLPCVSPESVGLRDCVPMAFTAKSPPAEGQLSSRELE